RRHVVPFERIVESWRGLRQPLHEGEQVDPRVRLAEARDRRRWSREELVAVRLEAADPDQPPLDSKVFATHLHDARPLPGQPGHPTIDAGMSDTSPICESSAPPVRNSYSSGFAAWVSTSTANRRARSTMRCN